MRPALPPNCGRGTMEASTSRRVSCPKCARRIWADKLGEHLREDLKYVPYRCNLCFLRFHNIAAAELHFQEPDTPLELTPFRSLSIHLSRHPGTELEIIEAKNVDIERTIKSIIDSVLAAKVKSEHLAEADSTEVHVKEEIPSSVASHAAYGGVRAVELAPNKSEVPPRVKSEPPRTFIVLPDQDDILVFDRPEPPSAEISLPSIDSEDRLSAAEEEEADESLAAPATAQDPPSETRLATPSPILPKTGPITPSAVDSPPSTNRQLKVKIFKKPSLSLRCAICENSIFKGTETPHAASHLRKILFTCLADNGMCGHSFRTWDPFAIRRHLREDHSIADAVAGTHFKDHRALLEARIAKLQRRCFPNAPSTKVPSKASPAPSPPPKVAVATLRISASPKSGLKTPIPASVPRIAAVSIAQRLSLMKAPPVAKSPICEALTGRKPLKLSSKWAKPVSARTPPPRASEKALFCRLCERTLAKGTNVPHIVANHLDAAPHQCLHCRAELRDWNPKNRHFPRTHGIRRTPLVGRDFLSRRAEMGPSLEALQRKCFLDRD